MIGLWPSRVKFEVLRQQWKEHEWKTKLPRCQVARKTIFCQEIKNRNRTNIWLWPIGADVAAKTFSNRYSYRHNSLHFPTPECKRLPLQGTNSKEKSAGKPSAWFCLPRFWGAKNVQYPEKKLHLFKWLGLNIKVVGLHVCLVGLVLVDIILHLSCEIIRKCGVQGKHRRGLERI